MDLSPLQKERYQYRPKLPALLKTRKPAEIKAVLGQPTSSYADAGELKKLFKNNFGAPIALFEPGNNPGAAAAPIPARPPRATSASSSPEDRLPADTTSLRDFLTESKPQTPPASSSDFSADLPELSTTGRLKSPRK